MAPERSRRGSEAGAVGVGLIGLGTIGTGVVRLLQEHGGLIDERLAFPLELRHIADIDLELDRGVPLDGYRLSSDWTEVVKDPEVSVVVELVGGTTIAREMVWEALGAGKGVVTANKALLAHHGPELLARAADCGTDIAFEASVGGTIPVLRALREGLCADRIDALHGIVNGTCNYILSEMESGGESYEANLKRAQDLGYAEADPSFDVNGTDSTHKLAILLGLGFGVAVDPDDIATEGIGRVTSLDIEYAGRFGLRIKLLAIAKQGEGGLEARVHPTMIPESSVLARVDGSLNAVEVHGRMSGPTLYYGAGAGSLPTASAVVADVMELARARSVGAVGRVPPLGTPLLRSAPLRRPEDVEGEYYLRFSVLDRSGVLARLAGALGERGISIASLVQPSRQADESVPIVMTTHRAREGDLRAALEAIDVLEDVTAPTQVIRIEREI
jgi:homoserine dehydrogenase